MKYHVYGVEKPNSNYKIAILVTDIKKHDIKSAYIDPYWINPEDVIVIELYEDKTKNKTPVAQIKDFIETVLVDGLAYYNVEYIICSDPDYFKVLAKSSSADKMYGYVVDSMFGSQKLIYVPNYKAIFYNPTSIRYKINQSIRALEADINGKYIEPGIDMIHQAEYPTSLEEIEIWLDILLNMECDLTCDIEGFSLKHTTSGIGSISFAWNQNEGIAIPVDILNDLSHSIQVRNMLRDFFENFKYKMIYHNISFDVYILIYQLFMKHILDTEGLLYGLEVMLRNWDDTKLISYLATNSCAGNKLSLKDQAQEYAGNYAVEEIKDIRKLPLSRLLQYNLIDSLSTWFVHKKHYRTLITDNQLDIYENIFKPAIKDIIQMQLTGMPINMDRVKKVKADLERGSFIASRAMESTFWIKRFNYELKEQWVKTKNETLKKKRVVLADAPADLVFNPNSGPQLIKLLYTDMGLPILDYTKTKLPSTGSDTLEKLKNHTKDQDIINFLIALISYKSVEILVTTFIPAFENAAQGPDGWHYLFGNFNLGGTVSGRLSSNDPNLQNIPATGTIYGTLIMSCFEAPPGWIFCGIDADSLEDKISALTTKDPNKLKVYTDGYDGHSLRAYSYFPEQLPNIVDTVKSINSIKKLYPDIRQASKAPTFALTYQGTYITLINNCGFTESEAKSIENRYHTLYQVSDEWIENKLAQACKDGYVTVAFGLRVRTPLLAQTILGTSKTPFAATREGRTAGNALGQSWCLLNNRAASEVLAKVRRGVYRLDIRPCAQIHDAQYYLIRDDIEVIRYANEHIVKALEWQNHPDIQHNDVKLGGKFAIFYPDWSKKIEIPNNASIQEIENTIQTHLSK